ncbi:MAG TPA: hypothetical protein VIF35_19650 [Streptosporangiaceae bacterium]|jgi:hypothetical protein
MIKRLFALAALPAAALAVTLGATAASASTGPPTYNNGSTEGGGYLASQAQFRYVQDSVYLRAQSGFAAIDDGVSWETHLYGIDTATSQPVQVVLAVGGDPQNLTTPYAAAASVNGTPMTTGGTTQFTAGQTITESIYYDRGTGLVHVSIVGAGGHVFFGSAIVGRNVAFTSPRVIGGIDPGSSFVPPSSPVKLGHFSSVMLTTYSGFHGSLWGWYQHAKMIVTSDGTRTGVLRVVPTNLSAGGTAFDAYFVPGT